MPDYDSHERKRAIQDKMFPLIKQRKLVALGGPNLTGYLQRYPFKLKSVEIWERDRNIMLEQLVQLNNHKSNKLVYRFGDILNAEVDPEAFYDLDFCGGIIKAIPHINKFKDCSYSITIALRPTGYEESLKVFLGIVNEKLTDLTYAKEYTSLYTDKNCYLCKVYKDTAAMLTIFKT